MRSALAIGVALYLAMSLISSLVANVGGRPDADINAFSSLEAFLVWFVFLGLLWPAALAYRFHVPEIVVLAGFIALVTLLTWVPRHFAGRA